MTAQEADAVRAHLTRSGYSDARIRVVDDEVAQHFVATQSSAADGVSAATVPLHVPCASPNLYLERCIDTIESMLSGDVQLSGLRRWPGARHRVRERTRCYLFGEPWLAGDVHRGTAEAGATGPSHMARKYAPQHRIPRTIDDVRDGLPLRPHNFDLAHVYRFIHRPTIARAAAALRPGGLPQYTHFLEGCGCSPVGRPKNAMGLFLRGGLAALLAAAGARVLRCDGGGRPIVCAPAGRPRRGGRAQDPARPGVSR